MLVIAFPLFLLFPTGAARPTAADAAVFEYE
jgi:hypothetical protein